jgi:hypothetical protein
VSGLRNSLVPFLGPVDWANFFSSPLLSLWPIFFEIVFAIIISSTVALSDKLRFPKQRGRRMAGEKQE